MCPCWMNLFNLRMESFSPCRVPEFTDGQGQTWELPAYDLQSKTYLEFDYDMSENSIKHDLLPRVHEFWNVILPAVGAEDEDD